MAVDCARKKQPCRLPPTAAQISASPYPLYDFRQRRDVAAVPRAEMKTAEVRTPAVNIGLKGRRRSAALSFKISRVRPTSPVAVVVAAVAEAEVSGTECRRSQPFHPDRSPSWAVEVAEAAAADRASLPGSSFHRGIHGWPAWWRTPKAQP